jgi:opacity protein-like surface antigen
MRYPCGAKIFVMSALCCGLAAAQVNAADSGWFLTGDVGPSFVNSMSVTTSSLFGGPPTTTRLSFNTGVRLDLDGGYQFNDSWALDMELGYIYNSVDFSNSSVTASRGLYQVPLLLNAMYTLPVDWRIKPYLGAGLGLVATGVNDLTDVSGAGQLLAGLKFQLSQRIDLGLAYKFLITTTHDWNDFLGTTQGSRTINNSILADIKFKF